MEFKLWDYTYDCCYFLNLQFLKSPACYNLSFFFPLQAECQYGPGTLLSLA